MGSAHVLILRAAGYMFKCPECGHKNVEPYLHPNILCGKCKANFTKIKAVHVKGKDPQTPEQMDMSNPDSITF